MEDKNKGFIVGIIFFLYFTVTLQAAVAYDGEWTGTTNQSYPVDFTIKENAVTMFHIKISGPGITIEKTVRGKTGIIGETFTISGEEYNSDTHRYDEYEYTGTFSNSTLCSGTWRQEKGYSTFRGTWDAHLVGLTVTPSDFTSGNVIKSFQGPPWINDLAFDGTNIWATDFSGIIKLDSEGNVLQSLDAPGTWPEGLAFGDAYLWHTDDWENNIYQLDQNGEVINTFDAPGYNPGCLTFDGAHLWMVDGSKDEVLQIDADGDVLSSFDCPGSDPTGLSFDGDAFWIADEKEAKLYQVDLSGNIIGEFKAPGSKPAGLVFDGAYLWNADSQDNRVYQLEPPSVAFVGVPKRVTFSVNNTGSTELAMGEMSLSGPDASLYRIENDNCTESALPIAESCTLDVVFQADAPGEKDAALNVPSSDIATPELTVPLKSNAVRIDLKGDVDGNDAVDMADLLIVLQSLTGIPVESINTKAEVNGDGQMGLEEGIYILRWCAGLVDL